MKCRICPNEIEGISLELKQTFRLGGIYLNQFCSPECLLEWIVINILPKEQTLKEISTLISKYLKETWRLPI